VVGPVPTPTPNLFAGISTDKKGGIYVVQGLSFPQGAVLKYVESSPGVFSQVASIGGFNIPNSSLSSDDGSILYVVDSSNEYIKRYLETPPGSNNYLYDTIVAQPGTITWGNQLARDPWGNFYVTDTNERHVVFDANWNFLYQCASTATPYPGTYGMAVDGSGSVYRGNTNNYIEKFQMCFPSPTITPTPTSTPSFTPTITPTFLTYTPTPPGLPCDQSYAYPNPTTGNTLKVHLQLCQTAQVTIRLYNTAGEKVGQVLDPGAQGPNDYSLDASALAPGIYYYLIQLDSSTGTRRLKPSK